ncbi:MAG: acyltransferase [Muribaculaceae bacterium]
MKERESNLEALRIVAMMAVIGVHLDGAALDLPKPTMDIAAVTMRDWWRLIVEAFTIIGVNCFTLISGYFGIRFTLKGFMRFAGQCLFYGVGICTVIMLMRVAAGGAWDWSKWCESWLVFTHTDLWYVPAYLGLFILSPLLNAGVKGLSQRQFGWMLVALVVMNVYAGWLQGGRFNANGYTIMQLVMMYLIGRYLGEYVQLRGNARLRYAAFSTYAVASLLTAVMGVYADSLTTFAYNQPLVIIASVALFVAFATMQFKSKMVNFLASGAFAAYLLHKNPYIWVEYVRPCARHFWAESSLLEFTVFYISFTVAIYLAAAAIDQVRRLARVRLSR